MSAIWHGVRQDAVQAVRSLRRRWAPSCTVILVVGLSIAVNTTVFSAVSAVLLRDLPFPHADRLVRVWFGRPDADASRSAPRDIDRWRVATTAFDALAAYRTGVRTLATGDEPGRGVPVAEVSASFFAVLGVSPTTGRAFRTEDEHAHAPAVVIVSRDLWSGGVITSESDGGSILLDGVPHRVVGVVPADFLFPDRGTRVWVPLRPPTAPAAGRGEVITVMETVLGFGRLKAGVTAARAEAEAHAIFGSRDPRFAPRVVQMREADVRSVRRALLVLQAAVFLVLVIACANVAQVLLARAVERQPEFAVRASLGASRYRLLRQWAMEGALLAGAGGGLGCVLTVWGIQWLRRAAPPAIGTRGEIGLDLGVVGFGVATTLIVAVLTIAIPGWRTLRWTPQGGDLCRRSAGIVVAGRNRTRRLLIGFQFALALALLVTALAVARSFVNLVSIDAGYDVRSVATAQLRIPVARYATPALRRQLVDDVLTAARGLPGVRRVGLANYFPLEGQEYLTFSIPGLDNDQSGRRLVVSDGYFETLGIRVVRGRSFGPADTMGAPPVVLVSRAFVAKYFGQADPLGRVIDANGKRWTIVGMTEDVRGGKLTDPAWPVVYYHYRQQGDSRLDRISGLRRVILFAHADGDPVSSLAALATRLRTIDAALTLDGVRLLARQLDSAVAVPRFYSTTMLAFTVLAVLLAALGVGGLVGYTVAQRVPEFGLRMALGATRRHIVLDIVRLVALPLGLGTMVGGVSGAWFSTGFRDLLFGVSPVDVGRIVWGAAVLLACAVLACIPAGRRAVTVDPACVLRQD